MSNSLPPASDAEAQPKMDMCPPAAAHLALHSGRSPGVFAASREGCPQFEARTALVPCEAAVAAPRLAPLLQSSSSGGETRSPTLGTLLAGPEPAAAAVKRFHVVFSACAITGRRPGGNAAAAAVLQPHFLV